MSLTQNAQGIFSNQHVVRTTTTSPLTGALSPPTHTAILDPYAAAARQLGERLVEITWSSPTDEYERFQISIYYCKTQRLVDMISTGEFSLIGGCVSCSACSVTRGSETRALKLKENVTRLDSTQIVFRVAISKHLASRVIFHKIKRIDPSIKHIY